MKDSQATMVKMITNKKFSHFSILAFLITMMNWAREIEGFSAQCMIFHAQKYPCFRSYSGRYDLSGREHISRYFPTSSSSLQYTGNPNAQTDTLENHPDWKAYIDSKVKDRIIYFNLKTGESFPWDSKLGKNPFVDGFCPQNQHSSQKKSFVDDKFKHAFEREFANGNDQQSSQQEPVAKKKHTFERDFKKSSFVSDENGASSYTSSKSESRNGAKDKKFGATSYKTNEEFPWDSHPSVHPFENVNSEYMHQDYSVPSNESKKYDFDVNSRRNSVDDAENFADSRKWTNSGRKDTYKERQSYRKTSKDSNSFNHRFQYRKKKKEPLQGIAYWEFYVEDELVSHFVVQTAESLQKARGWAYNGRKHTQKKKNMRWDPFCNF